MENEVNTLDGAGFYYLVWTDRGSEKLSRKLAKCARGGSCRYVHFQRPVANGTVAAGRRRV